MKILSRKLYKEIVYLQYLVEILIIVVFIDIEFSVEYFVIYSQIVCGDC